MEFPGCSHSHTTRTMTSTYLNWPWPAGMPGRGQSSITTATTAIRLYITAIILISIIIKKFKEFSSLEGPPLACSLYTQWAGKEGLSRPLGGSGGKPP